MRIKRLELAGFKSFPFSTAIDFPEGITAIVGPNGCGKSNILDALLWVMGATSPKLLRSRSMEDIIFAGAEGVAPLGRAEVRMVLDNSNGLACEPYRELPEIEIRRVVYRTGESEFWLNKHRCRLRDITEFFLGTGLGTNSYAIIEQGKVDAIINARPEERRLLLDESAGISKYKERREISLRKMEATKQNLARVEDILYEVNRQANRLKRQAAKARRYQRLKGELDALVVRRALFQWRNVQEKVEKLEKEKERLVQLVKGKETAWEKAEANVGEAQTKLLEREEELRDLSERFAKQRDVVDKGRNVLFSLRERRGRLEETLRGVKNTLKEIVQRREALVREKGKLEEEIAKVRNDLARRQQELEKRAAIFLSEKGRLERLETDFENHRRIVFETMTAEVEVKNKIIQLNERIEETKRGIKARESELKTVRDQIAALTDAELEQRRLRDSLKKSLIELKKKSEELQARLGEAEEQKRELEEQLSSLERELTENRSSLSSLLAIQQRLEDISSAGAKALMAQYFGGQKKNSSVCKLVADTIEIDPQYDKALEAVLRDELEFVVVDTHETVLQALSFLKEKKAGRSGLIPTDNLMECGDTPSSAEEELEPLIKYVKADEEEKKILSCLLKDVWVVKTPQVAFNIQKRNGFSGILVTLEGDVFYPNGVIVGGSEGRKAEGRIARNRKINWLKKKIRELEREKRSLVSTANRVRERVASLSEEFKAIRDDIQEKEIAFRSCQHEVERLETHREWVEKQVGLLSSEIEELCGAIETSMRQREEEEHALLEYRKRQEDLCEKTEDYEARIRNLKAVVEEKSQEIHQLKVEEAKLKEKLQSLVANETAVENQRKRLDREIEEKRHQILALGRDLEKLSGELNTLQGELEESEAALEVMKQDMEKKELLLRREKEAVVALEMEKSKIFKELKELKDELSAKQLELSRVGLESNTLWKEIKDRYQVDLREKVAADIEKEHPPEEKEIARLEEKLRQIGEINFVAVKEFEELKERITFLEQQRDDLLDAIQTLTETIQRINRTTAVRFKETFERIQGNFANLFVKLFGGGKAELRLTDPHNYRETGVEIFAQPPGKRLQVIRLLSGGEKALVAIAFLFALFLARPSPFCVLDEVDAPLDDNNIARFNQLIMELSEISQFILITHNKHTMACAKSLLGVTMEQPGVSKIVSVSLEEVGA